MSERKPILWLSYSWKDNVQDDIHFIAQEIEKIGITVHLDRFVITAGQRLWPQIQDSISNPQKSDAWSIFLSQNSLMSEPVKEEMAYALDRALSTRGANFPIIGISSGSVPSEDLPKLIGTRLFVDLRDREWVERIRSAVFQSAPNIQRKSVTPVELTWHTFQGKPVAEIRPRAGRWYPAYFAVKSEEAHLVERCAPAPSGGVTGSTMSHGGDGEENGQHIWVRNQNVTPIDSLYVYLAAKPTWMRFGSPDVMFQWSAEAPEVFQ